MMMKKRAINAPSFVTSTNKLVHQKVISGKKNIRKCSSLYEVGSPYSRLRVNGELIAVALAKVGAIGDTVGSTARTKVCILIVLGISPTICTADRSTRDVTIPWWWTRRLGRSLWCNAIYNSVDQCGYGTELPTEAVNY